MDGTSASLFDLLNTSLVLHQLAPYLSLPAKLALAATCKAYRDVLMDAPETFRYLDLSNVKRARLGDLPPIDLGGVSWRAERMDENLTEDEFYCGPLRGIFTILQRRGILKHVYTLILDGLSCPADLVQEIMTEDRFNVRMLSIRQATHLNERKLMQVLKYVCRPTRSHGTPRVKALYVFGKAESYDLGAGVRDKKEPEHQPASGGVMSSEGAQIGAEWNQKSQSALYTALNLCEDRWYQPSGRVVRKALASEWGATIKDCTDIIAFDAVLCRGPRHDMETLAGQTADTAVNDRWLDAAVATVALGPSGCVKCSDSTEGAAVFDESPPSQLPLLSPPPLHSSAVRYAQMPSVKASSYPPLFARCEDCLRGRWCERCFKWWDEKCYAGPQVGVMRSTEVREDTLQLGTLPIPNDTSGVQWGLCVEQCLVSEMMSGSGSFGMWG
ncbi:hypothetical protein FH972_025042 [Carpinus fangiana]|uniref:F-box domain-containing protein n=1 Tax=Carpinus fangiana TaxID=176857 RepID=A0A5N6L085_9ROSI|nr:hypothetical protein FH972_025042 [Carpinus fangiana]